MPDLSHFEIAPHPKRGTADASSERIVLLASELRVAEGSTDARPILEITSTSEGEDRHGSRIFEWRDESYMRTGQVLWQHDMCPWLPQIAKKLGQKKVGDRTVSTHELLIDLWRSMEQAYGNLPEFLYAAAKLHDMGQVSRAFIPLKMKSRAATTIPTELAENIDYLIVEQTEESYVNVQSNRDAVYTRSIEQARIAGRFSNGLARTLGFDVAPYVIQTTKERSMPTAESFRATIAGVLKRCCGCDSYREPKPDAITEEQKTADLAAISALVAAQLATLDAAVNAWKSTSQSVMRNTLSNIAASAMYSIEWLIYRAKEWYGEDLAITVPEIAATDLEAMTTEAQPPTATRTVKPAITPTRAAIVWLRSVVRSAREQLRDYWIDYSDRGAVIVETCDICGAPVAVGCECAEAVSTGAAAIEQATVGTLISIESQRLAAALAGWQGSEHDSMRDYCSSVVWECMWRVDRLLEMQEFWFADAEPTPISAVDALQLRAFVEAIKEKGDTKAFARIGAELSKKNKSAINKAHEHLTEAVRCLEPFVSDQGDGADAEAGDQGDGTRTIRIAGVSAEGAVDNAIRVVFAADPSDAGAGRSTDAAQRPFYGSDVLRVKG